MVTKIKGTSTKVLSWECQGAVNSFWTQGIGLLDPLCYKYSRTLIDTIFMCLAYDPGVRINAVELVKITNNIEVIYDKMCDGIDIGDDLLRNVDLSNIQPLGYALLYDTNGNGPVKPQPLDLGPVGMFSGIGKPFMRPGNEETELLFQGPYAPREGVTGKEYPFKRMEDRPPAPPDAPLKWSLRLRR